LWLGRGESVIGVLDEAALRPQVFLLPRLREYLTVEQIMAAGGVVPGDVLGGDVVMSGRRQARGNCEEDKTQNQRPLDFHGVIIPLQAWF
jgi:hypothetical protein